MSENTTPLAEVDMPERVTVTEVHEVPVEDVKVGDFVGSREIVVGAKRTGPKWTVLETKDGQRIVRLENGTKMPVLRDVETEESKTARFAAIRADRIVTNINGWTPSLPAVMAKASETVAKGYTIGYSELGSMAQAQADDIVWARYCNSVRVQVHEQGKTVLEAHEFYVGHLKEQILSAAQWVSNRSSNAYSNLMNDEEISAKGRFIERQGYVY